MAVLRVERPVDAPAPAVWDAFSDVEAISDVAPNVARAEADGSGEGMHRRCWDEAGNHWDETCVRWEEGRRYTFDVDTSTSGSRVHSLFRTFAGTFGVDERGSETVAWVEFDVRPKFGPMGRLFVLLLGPMFRSAIGTMLDNWVEVVEDRQAAAVLPVADR